MPTLTTPIQYSTESPNCSSQGRKTNKRHPHWKGRSKIVLVYDDTILYHPKEKKILKIPPKNLLELTNEFSNKPVHIQSTNMRPHVQGAVAVRAQGALEELFHVQGQEGRR